MEAEKYLFNQIGCPDCQIVCPPPYLELGYDRNGYVYVTVWCDKCKSKIRARFDIIMLMVEAEGRDGFRPAQN